MSVYKSIHFRLKTKLADCETTVRITKFNVTAGFGKLLSMFLNGGHSRDGSFKCTTHTKGTVWVTQN